MAAGGSLVLAGCGQNNTGTPTSGNETTTAGQTPTGTAKPQQQGLKHVEGQTLVATIDEVPEEESMLARSSITQLLFPTFNKAKLSPGSVRLQRVYLETGVWADAIYPGGGGKTYYNWIEKPIEITPKKVTVNIRDDAKWSDGSDITGKDIATIPLQQGLRKNNPPFYADDSDIPPQVSYHAIDGFDIKKKSVTYKSSAGHFDGFWNLDLRRRLGTFKGPHILETHIEPWKSYSNAIIDTARKAHKGEIDPWSPDSGDPNKQSLVKKHVAKPKWAKKFNKPKNVLATGVWDMTEIQGTKKFVFEKNEHHRNIGQVNFDRLELVNTPSDKRAQAALKADELDYASSVRRGFVPEAVVNSLPDHIQQLKIPGGLDTGIEIAINHDKSPVNNRKFRAAMMYAIDAEKAADAIQPNAAVPITNPGGDCWDAPQRVGQDWIDQNLITYNKDTEKAATLMREAGYTKDGDQWMGPDGEPVTLQFPTTKSTPRYEPVVADELTAFGIKTEMNSLSGSTYWQRLPNGEFSMWNGSIQSLTNIAPITSLVWFHSISDRPFNLYSDEMYEKGEFSEDGFPVPRTEERWKAFTVEAPPIGKPDGELQTYQPASLSLSVYTNPPVSEYKERLKTFLWLANWYLPTIPIAKEKEQHFIDNAHWLWPRESRDWQAYTAGDPKMRGGIFASGLVKANPNNPEEGASVRDS